MKDILDFGKKFLLSHRNKIEPTVTLATKCMAEVASLSQLQKPSVYSYLSTGLKCKEHYDLIFKKDELDFFLNDKWESFSCYECRVPIAALIENLFGKKIKLFRASREKDYSIHVVNFENFDLGWISRTQHIDSMFISTGKQKEAYDFIGKCLWVSGNSKSLFLGLNKSGGGYNPPTFLFYADTACDKFINSKQVKKYSEYVKKFLAAGYGKSLLFYGKPGTGKSNLSRGLAASLGMRSLRVKDLNEIKNRALTEAIKLLDPDVILLEDIDHLYSYDVSTLLEKIEDFNLRKKCLLATANEVSKINSALLRPGRFDELKEIKTLDREELEELVQDPEVLEIVKDYPVAFINEVLKRISAVGKEEALKEIEDIKSRISNLEEENYKL